MPKMVIGTRMALGPGATLAGALERPWDTRDARPPRHHVALGEHGVANESDRVANESDRVANESAKNAQPYGKTSRFL